MLVKLKKVDWSIVLILVLFMLVSTMLVYSATVDDPRYGVKGFQYKNLINYTIGFIVFFIVAMVDYRAFIKTWMYHYLFGISLLVLLYFFGSKYFGATGWISLPLGFDFQPAELMKVLIILAVSACLAKKHGERLQLVQDVIPIGAIVLLPFLLVVAQPDLGNAMIFLVILLGMYWIGNVKYTHVLIGLTIIVGFLVSFFFVFESYHTEIQKIADDHKAGHWVQRIDTFIDPSRVTNDEKLQYVRSKIAIGSGSLIGDGYLKGDSVHHNFIPVVYSDAIFVVVGEEFGFVGSSALLLLYFILIYRMILISIQSNDLGGSYIIVGIVSMYVFQIFQNIGMFIGLMPLTGITLPFISYGGTSLFINMLSLGLVMSVRLNQEKESMFSTDD